MSTFSGLSTALSSLNAQRQALEVSGQNIANANTVGYTRQRADLKSVEPASVTSIHSGSGSIGNGTRVSGIARLGDVFADARLRGETGAASGAATSSQIYLRLESTIAEPGDQGVSHALDQLWSSFGELGNTPDSEATRAVVLQDANAVADRISSGYAAVKTQWGQARTELESTVSDVNTAAGMVADLNSRIRALTASGSPANELVDQRSELVTKLAGQVGASAVERPDGTLDVMVAGNALVRGDRAHALETNPSSYTMGSDVTVRWAGTGTEVHADAGQVASLVSALGPVSANGTLATAARSYDTLASTLISGVNGLHAGAMTAGAPQENGGPFFAVTPAGSSAAETLTVAITDTAKIAVAAPGKGPHDGSVSDALASLATDPAGPNAAWSTFVVGLGVASRSASQQATVTEATRSTAAQIQMAGASVDIDEESVNMLSYQRAYEGAARVLTAIDEMLDTLINRTGTVGR
jgi:flagellar hook-associated protein 1 FlgK